MSYSNNSQLTNAKNYKPTEQMIFSDVISGEIPDSKPKIEFKRINISTKYEDGTIGDLIIPTQRVYSFGVSENKSMETGKVSGYTFPLCLWNRDGPTKEEKVWTDTFESIVECVIDHLVANRDEIDMYELTRTDLTKSKGGLNPLYWKKEKHKDEATGRTVLRVVPGSGPTLYSKLIYAKKHDKFVTNFYDINDEQIDARDLMGKHCYATGAVKLESIFIGSRISLQIKLYEGVVEPVGKGMKRLLRPQASSKVLASKTGQDSVSDMMGSSIQDDDDDEGSLNGDVEEEVVEPPVVKKTIKKVVRKVRPKE